MKERFPLLAAGILGATGIVVGAMGRHLPPVSRALLDHGTAEIWERALSYQMYHAAALLGAAAWMRTPPHGAAARRAVRSVRWLLGGTVLFSGSLYLYALGAGRAFGWLTPFGGVGMAVGWIYLAGAALAPKSEYDL